MCVCWVRTALPLICLFVFPVKSDIPKKGLGSQHVLANAEYSVISISFCTCISWLWNISVSFSAVLSGSKVRQTRCGFHFYYEIIVLSAWEYTHVFLLNYLHRKHLFTPQRRWRMYQMLARCGETTEGGWSKAAGQRFGWLCQETESFQQLLLSHPTLVFICPAGTFGVGSVHQNLGPCLAIAYFLVLPVSPANLQKAVIGLLQAKCVSPRCGMMLCSEASFILLYLVLEYLSQCVIEFGSGLSLDTR